MKQVLLLSVMLILVTFAQTQSPGGTSHWCLSEMHQSSTGSPRNTTGKEEKQPRTVLNNPNGVIKIPVIFHLLNDVNNPNDYITYDRVVSQLARINIDFRKQNQGEIDALMPWELWKSFAVDLRYEFVLACIDPQGNTLTEPGVTRKDIQVTIEYCNQTDPRYICTDAKLTILGGDDAWPTDTYLNIWVCDMTPSKFGHSAFPEDRFEPPLIINGAPYDRREFDGITLDYSVVGDPSQSISWNKGRVLTHEIGHWLGLYHLRHAHDDIPCSQPGDFVSDTPPQHHDSFGCPSFPETCQCTLTSPGVMFMNYMNGTDDNCRYFYTAGQKDRARSYFSQNGPLGTRYPFIDTYFGILCPISPYIVQNNIITVKMKNPACLPVIYEYSGLLTILSQNDHEIVFSVPCNSNGTITLSAMSGNYTDNCTFSYVNPASCNPCSPFVSPAGPIDYYTAMDAGPSLGVVLTSSVPSGNQWYLNDQIIQGATGQTLTIDWNFGFGSNIAGLYHTVVNGCPSNKISYSQFFYGYGWHGEEPFNFGAKYYPVNTPSFYCINTNSTIKQFDLGLGSDYSWFIQNRINPLATPNISLNPSTYNPYSPIADIIIGNDANSFTFIKGTANNNGRQKIIEYDYLYESPYSPPRISGQLQTCVNQTVNIYTIQEGFYSTWSHSNPGSSYFDWEEYEFGPNTNLLNYLGYVISTNPLILRVPGKNQQSSPIMVTFSGPSYIHKRFYYNSPMPGCAREDLNVVATFGGCLRSKVVRINEFIDLKSTDIYPNPANSIITINSPCIINKIEVYNSVGILIKQKQSRGQTQINIPIHDIPTGIYTCKVYSASGIETLKIVIQRQ